MPVLRWLVLLALGLPMLVLVLQFGGAVLAAMGDEPAARVLRAIATTAGILWAVTLLGMLIVLAIDASGRNDPPRDAM